jgi:DNA repair protein RadA/Sms
MPRREFNGSIITGHELQAVLEKRSGLRVSGCDAYINVVALTQDEPSSDLAAVLALASSFRDKRSG